MVDTQNIIETKKADSTRERILKAARKVFSEHSYKAASVRMIGKEGGFDHPLISYYYPSKAMLFEAVVEQICGEYYRANVSWLEGLERMGPEEGLSLYIDRFLDYNFKRPQPLRIIMQNAAQFDRLTEVPGYQHIPKLLSNTRGTFEQKIKLSAGPDKIGMFLNSFNSLVLFYLGAGACQAAILGMDPEGDEYRAWVKNALMYVFLPLLMELIDPKEQ